MLRKINKIIKKNFLLLIRSKGSSLIVILGPLLLILLVGLAFSHSKPYSIDVGVYTKTPNDLTTDVLKKLNEEQFKVVEYTNSKECVESVKKGDVDICMFFPDNFIIREKQRNTITFNVDYSNINLVYAVLEVITQKVNEESKEISVDLTEDLLTVLENTKNEVNKDLEAVVQLNKQDEKISEKSDSIKARLKELNLEFNKDNFKLNELTLKIDAIKKIAPYTYFSNSSIAQYAALEALETGNSTIIKEHKKRRDLAIKLLSPKFEVHGGDGAFYLFLRAPNSDGDKFVERAAQKNLLLLPGSLFSTENTHFRLSYATPIENLKKGAEIINKLVFPLV